MLIVVSYDVVSNRRRTRLAEALKDFGERVQLSVFECDLEAGQLDRLRVRIEREIDGEEDSVRIYGLCGHCREKVEVLGLGEPPVEDPEVYVV